MNSSIAQALPADPVVEAEAVPPARPPHKLRIRHAQSPRAQPIERVHKVAVSAVFFLTAGHCDKFAIRPIDDFHLMHCHRIVNHDGGHRAQPFLLVINAPDFYFADFHLFHPRPSKRFGNSIFPFLRFIRAGKGLQEVYARS